MNETLEDGLTDVFGEAGCVAKSPPRFGEMRANSCKGQRTHPAGARPPPSWQSADTAPPARFCVVIRQRIHLTQLRQSSEWMLAKWNTAWIAIVWQRWLVCILPDLGLSETMRSSYNILSNF